MSFPPVRYKCCECGKDNYINPHPDYFICRNCGEKQKAILSVGMFWWSMKGRGIKIK